MAGSWARRRGELDGSKVIVGGRSLGGAVAIAAAARLQSDAASSTTGLSYSPPAALVVENSFTSISAMVDAKFPFLNIPFFKVLPAPEGTLLDHPPPLPAHPLLSSARDEIVPASQMVALHDAARPPPRSSTSSARPRTTTSPSRVARIIGTPEEIAPSSADS